MARSIFKVLHNIPLLPLRSLGSNFIPRTDRCSYPVVVKILFAFNCIKETKLKKKEVENGPIFLRWTKLEFNVETKDLQFTNLNTFSFYWY